MLVLYETAAGFAIFKVLDENKLKKVENLHEEFETSSKANKMVQLLDFKKFADSNEAMMAGISLNEGKICKPLKKILKKIFVDDVKDQLLVWDPKLGSTIKEKLDISVLSSGVVGELMRCIKSQVDSLIPGLSDKELSAMSLGLGHNLARYKLKFSPDKVDTMIVHAVSLLDDIDKEVNNYIMRAKEWYGWHFPELSKIITENDVYIKTVLLMGTREKACDTDFSDILPEELEEKVKIGAEISMGTEITEDDLANITCLCEQIVDLLTYRTQLYEYLKNRMLAIAPNLTILVGELVGARLISHAGSLMNLAKHPASTIQILGAEKALFRALKTRKSTPKYGMIYHAQMVGQTSNKNKGKVSRMLAAKAALAIRYDALAEETNIEMGMENKSKLTSRVRFIESGSSRGISGRGKSMAKFEKYENNAQVSQYHAAADSTLPGSAKRKFEEDEDSESPWAKVPKFELGEAASDKKKLIEEIEPEEEETEKKKKKKKKKDKKENEDVEMEVKEEVEEEEEPVKNEKKKKKKENEDVKMEVKEEVEEEPVKKNKKKKKKKSKSED